MMVKYIAISSLVAALVAPAFAWSHGAATHEKKANPRPAHMHAETPWGKPGDPKSATLTVKVSMTDNMHFSAGNITVNQGEIVKFVVKNDGKLMHEMVIGTMHELKAHHELMKKHPGMEHDEPYMAHVSPGKTGEVVWQFTEAGEFFYACLIPGHMEAGMINKINVTPSTL
jgi:uncharacterized cupredoxin-like copper-binding protein